MIDRDLSKRLRTLCDFVGRVLGDGSLNSRRRAFEALTDDDMADRTVRVLEHTDLVGLARGRLTVEPRLCVGDPPAVDVMGAN